MARQCLRDAHQLNARAVAKLIERLSPVLRWAMKRGYITNNPTESIATKGES